MTDIAPNKDSFVHEQTGTARGNASSRVSWPGAADPSVSRQGTELVVSSINPLAPRTVIELDDLPWVPYVGVDRDPSTATHFTKTLVDPRSDNFVMSVKILSGGPGRTHWHLSDTLYIVRRGEMFIPGEGTYREGSFRWAKGGFAYGPEMPGEEGVEMFFVSMGPYDVFFNDENPPPLGSWDDPA